MSKAEHFIDRPIRRRIAGAAAAFAAVAAGAVTFAVSSSSIGAEPGLARHNILQNNSGYRLLRFTGAPMKWGAGRLGTAATISWRVATKVRTFEGARNCGAVTPIENALTTSDISRDAFAREMRAAMRMWEDVAGITFRPARPGEKADLVIGAQLNPRGRAFTNVSATQIVKVAGRRRVDRLDQAVVCLNPERPWKIGFDGDLKVYDIRHTLAHELGHVMGLDHVGAKGAVMAFRYDEAHAELTRGDVLGAQRVYGLPAFLAKRHHKRELNLVSARSN